MKYLVAVSAGFAVGTIVAATDLFGVYGLIFAGLIGLSLLLSIRFVKNKVVILSAIFFLVMALGGGYTLWYQNFTSPSDTPSYGKHNVIEGTVVKTEDREKTQHVVVESEELDTKVLVITSRFPEFNYGDIVTVAGVLNKPESFETDTGRVFDYPNYLAKDGIYVTMVFSDIEKVGEGGGSGMWKSFINVRDTYVQKLAELLPEPHAGLAAGITAGVRRALGDDLLDVFRVVGVIHIIVLSGYNVTIVAEAVTKTLGRWLGRNSTLIVSAVGIILFALLVGPSATVVRASIMALLVVIARALHRNYDVMRALLLAGLIMLLQNPLIAAFDPSFQLSFVATLGLVLFSPSLERLFSKLPEWGGIRFIVVATLATQIFVLPLLLAQVGQLSLVAPIANIFILIAVPAAMTASALVVMLGLIHPYIALPAVAIAYVLLGYIVWVAELFARIPYAAVTLPAFSLGWVFVLYAVYAAFLFWLQKRGKLSYE